MRIFTSILAVASAAGISALACGQAHYHIVDDKGKVEGEATMDARLMTDGSIRMKMTVASSPTTTFTFLHEVASDGSPVLDSVEEKGKTETLTLVAQYTSAGVRIRSPQAGSKDSSTIPYPKGANLRDPSDFWFVRDHPRVGAVVQYSAFDIRSMKFVKGRTVYLGDHTYTYRGRAIQVHSITSDGRSILLDDHALPFVFQLAPGLTLKRE